MGGSKMKNLLKLCFLFLCLGGLLTGCMYADMDMTISTDGKVVLTSTSGFTEAGMEYLKSFSGEENSDLSEYNVIEENGIKYYVATETQEFDISEYNSRVNGEAEDSEEVSTTETGETSLYQNEDGSIVFKFVATEDTTSEESMKESLLGEGTEMSEEEAEELVKGMIVRWKITFPSEVTQIAGSKDGIYIDGNTLKINVMEVKRVQPGEKEEYIFESAPVKDGENKEIVTQQDKFADVVPTAWYYKAVNALAEGGLVNGIGDGLFAPSDELTIGQFCSILARAKGFELGELNGHWAGKAVQSCIDAGYIISGEQATADYCNRAMTREEAVSAMYLAKADSLSEVVVEEVAIPDYEEISPAYKVSIEAAYKYGITSGMDDAHTFAPKSLLTRAQICQLFYNLGWTTIE